MTRSKWLMTGLSWLWVTILFVGVDRYTKNWSVANLIFQEPREILPFFNLTLAYNTGAAFSFLHAASGWQNIFFSGMAFLISAVVVVWLFKTPARDRWLSAALALILAGALGNAWDRLQYGYVIDFLDFHYQGWHFAIFNIADSAICLGAFMLCVHWFRSGK